MPATVSVESQLSRPESREQQLERRVVELEQLVVEIVTDRDQRLAEKDRQIAELQTQVALLMKRVEELEGRLKQNSRNSNRPPSTDPPWTPRPPRDKGTGRKRGGQPGHPGKARKLLPPDQVDKFVPVIPKECEDCHAPLPEQPSPNDPAPHRHQVFESPKTKPIVTEYQGHARTCSCCGKVTRAELPPEITASCLGPRAQAQVALLTGRYRLSRREAEEALEDFCGISVSLGTVSAVEEAMSDALAKPYDEALEAVREAPVLYVDETGWPLNFKKAWLWVAVSAFLTVFRVDRNRSKAAFQRFLGAFGGVVMSDRAKAYGGRPLELRGVCWAHLERQFQKHVDLGGSAAPLAQKALDEIERLFAFWYQFKREEIDRAQLRKLRAPLMARFHRILEDGLQNADSKFSGFCAELLPLWTALWTFSRVEGVEPTNNNAERAIRPAVLWRKGCFGSQSERGTTFVARILTAVASLRKQERSVLDFLEAAIQACRTGMPPPSLLPVKA